MSTDGRFVCWHDAPQGDQGRWVYLYDTVDEVTYHYYGGKDDGWCQVGDGHWVWLHSAADGTTTVYYHDMYEQSTTVYAISPPGQNCSFPLPYMVRVVDDDYVVWSVEQGSLSTLVLHRLSTDSDQTLAGPGRIDWAQVSDGIVAWIQDDGGVADVWAHDIIDGSTVRLTDDEFDEEFVLAGPDGVAWNRLGGMEGYQLWVALKATAEKPIFVDVPWLHPYREAIEGLYRGGVVSGSRVIGDERYFDPQNPVRRAQFAKMIVGTLGLPPAGTTQTRFLDLGSPDAFGYPHIYVQVAYDHGITNGTNPAQSLFAPWNYIRRDQVVSMIVRAAVSEAPGVLQNPPPGHPSYFAGVPEPHGANLRIAEYNGLMAGLTGFGSGWSESQNASRGEVAQMLWNLLGKIGE